MRLGCTCDRGLEHPGKRGVPYDRTQHCPACYAFWHNPEMNRARGGQGVSEVHRAPTLTESWNFCTGRGKKTGETKECKTCSGKIPVPMYECEKLGGLCYVGAYSVSGATRCDTCASKTPSDPTDPKVGVVVGSYLWPQMVALQIKLIRRTCGAQTPILVTDDCSPDEKRLRTICDTHGVELVRSESKIGHVGGDAQAFYYGIKWAREHGITVLAKLSQRLLLTRPRWLQEGAKELLASGLPLATRRAVGHLGAASQHFPTRSECCLLHVSQWDEERIKPKVYNPGGKVFLDGETLLLQATPGGIFWPWSEIAGNRFLQRPNEVNHWANSKSDYQAIAKELGITLDPSFHADGWEKEYARGEYSHG